MDTKLSFGHWVKQQRKALDLTQHTLAQRIGCALSTIQKIEIDVRQPSHEMAELLADHLEIAPAERDEFLRLARHQPSDEAPLLTLAPDRQFAFNNVPSPLTSLIGREWEVTTLCAELLQADVRLLTITGPPGIGKTRLSLQVATEVQAHFADGVCFVGLAPVADANFLLPTVMRTLGLKDNGHQSPLTQLKAYFQHKQFLLVLDNFEHLLPAAPLIAELLEAAPRLKALVTSRALLQVYGEHEFVTPPLALPTLQPLPTPQALMGYAAIELFVQRARAAKLDFVLSAENAPAVAELCVRLDGLPLAIELAAARSKQLAPQALLAHWVNPNESHAAHLGVLNSSAANLPSRQQTLRNAIAWSHELLNPTEQRIFRSLGVFVGGCTLEALKAVVSDLWASSGKLQASPSEEWLLDIVYSLINKSLVVQATPATDAPRFLLLEMMREFALEQLEQHGETEPAHCAHASYFLQVARSYAMAHEEGRGRAPGIFVRAERELDNLRTALRWAAAHNPELELQLAVAMTSFWSSRRYLGEGSQWLEHLLLRLKPTAGQLSAEQQRLYARLVHMLAFFTWEQGDYALAQTRCEASVALWRQLEEPEELAVALQFLGLTFFDRGDYTAAYAPIEESVRILHNLGESGNLAIALKNWGRIQLANGDASTARTLVEASIAIMRKWGNTWGVSNGLLALSEVFFAQGDDACANTCLNEALLYYRGTDETWFLAQTLLALGKVVWHQGDKGQAAVLLEESVVHARTAGAKRCLGNALLMLGLVTQGNGDRLGAKTLFAESLTLFQAMGSKTGLAYVLSSLAGIIDQPKRAATILGAAATILDRVRLPMDQIERTHYERTVAAVRARLDEAAFAAAWAAGQVMTLDEVVTLALG